MNPVLYVAWRSGSSDHGKWGPVGRLEHGPHGYRFAYTRGARTLPGFPPFTGMPDLEEVYESEQLFPLFANRLLSRSRPEYEAFLQWGAFDPNDPPDPLAILAVTEGRRETDAIEVFPSPIRDDLGRYAAKFFLHGLRWMTPGAIDRIGTLSPGEALALQLENENPSDEHAVAVYTTSGPVKIGYIPRYLARDVRELWDKCGAESIQITLQKVNPAAPIQHRVLCCLNSCWPEDFDPCNREEFQLIPSGMLALPA